MLRVHEINVLEDLGEYRTAWTRLLADTARPTFFQTLEWLEVYWRHFGTEQQLRAMIVTEGSQPIGILPLVVKTESTRVGPIRYLTYPLDYWGSYFGPIGFQPELVLQAGLAHIQQTDRDWDVLELRWQGHTDESLEKTEEAMGELGYAPCATRQDHTAQIRLTGSWEAYLASRTRKWRNNYRRWKRKLTARGKVEHLRYRPPGEKHGEADPRWDLYETCLRLAENSWQGSSTTGTTLTHSEVAEFLRDAHEAAARTGSLDLNLLYCDEQPVAFAYNYSRHGYVYGLRVGFDPDYAREGAGNLLYALTIEDSFERGDRLYDLGPSGLDGKRSLLTEVRPLVRLSYFPLLPMRAQLLRLKRSYDRLTASHADA